MPVIIGVYLWIPFLARGLQKSSPKEILLIVAVSVMYGMLLNEIRVITVMFGNHPMVLGRDFWVLTSYALYVVIGWLLYKQVFRKIKSIVLWIIAISGITIITALMFFSDYRVWYNSGFLLLASVAIFELMSRMELKENKILTSIARCSFGIYWVHSVVQKAVAPYIIEKWNNSIATLILWAASFIISWICVEAYVIIQSKLTSK